MTNAANIKAEAAFTDAREAIIGHLVQAKVDFDDVSTDMITAINRVSSGHSHISTNALLAVAGCATDIVASENDNEKAKYARRFADAVGTLITQVKDDHDDLCATIEFVNLCVRRAAAERYLATIAEIGATLS